MINTEPHNQWALADLASAIAWSKTREKQGISVALDSLGEYAKTPEQAKEAAANYLATAQTIHSANLKSVGIATKLSAMGLTFDRPLAEKLAREIVAKSYELNVPVEIDIEGTPSVEATWQIAKSLAEEGFPVILALQAYLDRTQADMEQAIAAGIKTRLVKGAYRGDTTDFGEIQSRFIRLFEFALAAEKPFDVGTHDPELIETFTRQLNPEQKKMVTFGFLKGLADETKLSLKAQGFMVSEYVPFGDNRAAYVKRREMYLKTLSDLGRKPAP